MKPTEKEIRKIGTLLKMVGKKAYKLKPDAFEKLDILQETYGLYLTKNLDMIDFSREELEAAIEVVDKAVSVFEPEPSVEDEGIIVLEELHGKVNVWSAINEDDFFKKIDEGFFYHPFTYDDALEMWGERLEIPDTINFLFFSGKELVQYSYSDEPYSTKIAPAVEITKMEAALEYLNRDKSTTIFSVREAKDFLEYAAIDKEKEAVKAHLIERGFMEK